MSSLSCRDQVVPQTNVESRILANQKFWSSFRNRSREFGRPTKSLTATLMFKTCGKAAKVFSVEFRWIPSSLVVITNNSTATGKL